MEDFQAWLAAMPVADVRRRIVDLEQQIAQLGREAEVMRLLLAQRGDDEFRPPEPSPSPGVRVGRSAAKRRGRRLSPEREAILRVLSDYPDGASPQDIARRLDKDANPIQTNLSRMTHAEMVERIGTGLYRLPPTHPTEGVLPSPNGNGTLTLDRPSGSEGEAMEP